MYGALIFLAGSLPVFALVFAAIRISHEVVLAWVSQNLVQYLIAGAFIGCVSDGATVRVSSKLHASADEVWCRLLTKASFLFITQRMMTFSNHDTWSDPLFSSGMSISTHVRFFGRGPAMPHQIRIARVDHVEREIDTEESGGLVSTWDHRMRVTPISADESLYADRIHLHAHWLTPLVWLYAWIYYRHRHKRWRALLTAEQPTRFP